MSAKSVEEYAKELGANTAKFMVDDEDDYYAGADLDELLDDAWMMGATQDSFAEAGFPLNNDNRRAALKAFSEGFRAAFESGADEEE